MKLKDKAKMSYGCAMGANWRTSAPPITAGPGHAPPIKADDPPKYKAAYAGMTYGGGEMRHTTFRGKH